MKLLSLEGVPVQPERATPQALLRILGALVGVVTGSAASWSCGCI
jgi:hypothetical protein